ncbi:hypothetical protein [Micavibrio aeruginosavorus]|uniref:hypothetical protein n=1 Tax=Micavibrio aeruginosavorus TaxID=349221 RepID=UPI003F4A9B02
MPDFSCPSYTRFMSLNCVGEEAMKKVKQVKDKEMETKGYDYDKIKGIVDSLQYLKEEARNCGNEDVEILIQSMFNIMITTYCMLLRERLPRQVFDLAPTTS